MKWQKSALIARSADTSWEFQRYFCQKRHPEYWKLQTILPIWQEAREAMRALSCGHSQCGGAGGPSSAGQGVLSAHSQHSQKTSLFQKVLQRMGRWRRPSAWLCTLIKMTLGFSCSYSHSSELHVILHLGIPSVQPSPRQPPASHSHQPPALHGIVLGWWSQLCVLTFIPYSSNQNQGILTGHKNGFVTKLDKQYLRSATTTTTTWGDNAIDDTEFLLRRKIKK